MKRTLFAAMMVCLIGASEARAANITPYYLFDGDSQVGYEITNGTLTNTFTTFFLGYPPAIRDTIWLGQRDDSLAREYTLAGVATGNTSVGGSAFSQLLDGAAGAGALNYGVECCGTTNSVTVANADWTNQQVLFNISYHGTGIAFDLSDNTLFVSSFSGVINHYTLGGALLGSFGAGSIVGLSYEQATDTIWGFNTATDNLVQFSKAGAILQDVDIPNFSPTNPFGGEMRIQAAPEPASMLLLGTGLLGAGVRRWRQRRA